MELKVMTPQHVVVEARADRIQAEGLEGEFGLLPRHIDMVTTLVPGILTYVRDGSDHYLAVNEGILVKTGSSVLVSVTDAVAGEAPASLEQTVRNRFEQLDEQARSLRSSLDRLQADIVRRFVEINKQQRGGG